MHKDEGVMKTLFRLWKSDSMILFYRTQAKYYRGKAGFLKWRLKRHD